MFETVIFIAFVFTFTLIALAIALMLSRRWREHKLPECIQRHLPVYDPLSYYQSKVTIFGIPRDLLLGMVPEFVGTFIAALTFGDLVIAVLGLQLDQVG
jgi:hypothetical protein